MEMACCIRNVPPSRAPENSQVYFNFPGVEIVTSDLFIKHKICLWQLKDSLWSFRPLVALWTWFYEMFCLTCTVMQYKVLPMVSQYCTDLQVAVTHPDMLQCTSKGRETDCKLVNRDVNDAGFKILWNVLCKCFMGKKIHNTFVRPQRFTQCIVSNAGCKLVCLQENSTEHL